MIDFKYYRNKIKTGDSGAPSLAVYMVRDLPEVKAAGLDDLAWALARDYCGEKDALYFFDLLEKAMERENG